MIKFFSWFPDGQSSNCNRGYALLSTGCYLKTGKITNKTDGVGLCKGKGGHLVTIESIEEQSDVIGLLGDDAQGDHLNLNNHI